MVYVAMPVSAPQLPEAIRGLRALGIAGANVTTPHKTAVVPLLDEVRGDAQVLRAVNTIVVQGRRLVGHNTDVEGFVRAFAEAVPQGHSGGTALILGAGGAARAVALGALRLGFDDLLVVNRTPAAAEDLVALVGEAAAGAGCTVLPLAELTAAHVRSAALVVNATTLGMSGASKVPATLADNVGVDQIVYDLVYARGPTDLTKRASKQGARVVDGLAMLVHQAAAAFQLWTNRAAPLDVMKRVVGG